MPACFKALADKLRAIRGWGAECDGINLQIRSPQCGNRIKALYIRMPANRVDNCRKGEPVGSCDSWQMVGPGADAESDYGKLKDGLLVLHLWMTIELIRIVGAGIRTFRTVLRLRKNQRAAS